MSAKKSPKKNSAASAKKVSDMKKVEDFLKKNKILYELGSNNGITPYIFMSFGDDGKTEKPCD